jgi:endonuclease/exonuclease/phosphatase family metal-dependent hydrolase
VVLGGAIVFGFPPRRMHKFIVALIFVGLGYLGYVIWQDLEKKRTPPPVEATPTPTPTPPPTPEPAPTPEPVARYAPEGILYVVKRFSEPHDGGVRGFSPGAEVRLLRQEAGYFVVTDGETEARRPRSWFTRDIQLAEELRAQKALTDQQIAERQSREKQAYEKAQSERAARWEAALASVEANRQVARDSAQVAASTRPELKSLRLGAWNLEHFGSRNDPPRTDEDMQAIADYIRDLDVQVLAVCEINGEKPLKELVKRIGPDWKFVLGTTGRVGQDGQVAPGVLWDNARVEMVGAGELSELSGQSPSGLIFHRAPVVAAFRDRAGGPDFRVVSVHFKAGRTPEDFDRRTAEGKSLRGYLEKLVSDDSEDDDIVVLGDFNHDPSAGEADAWKDGGFAKLLTGRGRSIIHFDRQIDHAVPIGTFEEIREGSFTIHNKEGLRDDKKWRTTYSDHFPVTVELEAVPDDDPAAKTRTVGRPLR